MIQPVLKEHQNMAYVTAWLFTASALLEFLKFLKPGFIIQKRLLTTFSVVIMAVGSVYLIYVGYLGANLVYQQGAGVYHPSGNCAEFD